MDFKILSAHTQKPQRHQFVNLVPKSSSVPALSTARNAIIAIVIFFVTHFALLVGVGTPDKFYFDEVHYVPAARQMLAPATSAPMLNPMHPPLAKQLIALSIRGFGDNPLGWRYPGVLFGSLAIVAVYLCGLVLFAAQGPAVAAALLAFFNQMVFVQSRIAMLDIFALAFGLFAIAAFMHGFRKPRPQLWFALAGLAAGLSTACKWSGLFVLATCIVIVAAIRLMQGWRTRFADGSIDDWYRPDLWHDFKSWHFAICFVLVPAVVYLATFVPLYGLSLSDLVEAQRRIFGDNTTTAIAGHTYMSAWPSWPFLVRPVWFLFDKIGDDRISAIVQLGNPLVLWPALPALAVCLRDWIVARRYDAFLILAFYFGLYLAWALLPRTLGFLYYYLPSATVASLALVYVLRRGNSPRWLLWAFVAVAFAGFAAMLPISAGFVGTSMQTFNRLMIFQNWI
ncbi:MAG: phospholipid carrier-dependent glycosyltransferase [Bradyrhizobium sp.]|jgi:dolichyl-phosphate-mannose--protein O-mannosyl transferase|nr:MAG: phospholipid carrier-dependent glycosyltransferase [Bradyrhizobium sp.]